MMKIFISIMLMSNSMIMFFLNHPLSMGLMILMQTLLTCLLSGLMMKTYWFSYILFLTFLGGMLVLFIYVSSIASNELFNMSIKLKLMFLIMMILSIFMSMMFMNNLNWMNLFFNSDSINMININMFINNEDKLNLSKLYNSQTNLMMYLLIIYLFITLVAVVKITNIFYGPLRKYF